LDEVLASSKDLREHHFVVNSIVEQLLRKGIKASHPSQPKLITQGHLIHLHTLIQASVKEQSPLDLVEALHPTPAVAGLPLSKSLSWLRALEPFDRKTYASPIGWIDKNQNSEFRVAIRYGQVRGNELKLFAGAGLVKGSTVEGEMQEVALKFEVLRNQLNLDRVNCSNDL
jgi:menaquinone-specific isochorismate synthase